MRHKPIFLKYEQEIHMTNIPRRRTILIALSALALAACGGGNSAGGISESELVDMSIGSDTAPVVLVEYASSVCPACAAYHVTMEETIKTLVEEGKLRYVFREFARDNVDTAGFAVARCAGSDKYFDVLGDLFENQRGLLQAARNGTVRASLQTIAGRHGLDQTAFEACMVNEGVQNDIRNSGIYGQSQGVKATPTLFLNGVELNPPEGRTPESLIALVEDAQ